MQKAATVIDQATQKNINSWLSGDYDESTKEEIRRLQKENPAELVDAFYTTLTFGTGGLRGVMGVGTNRMNIYTVREATQKLANYLKKHTPKPSVLISFDSRHRSQEFAKETAKVLAANAIEVFLYKELHPVPLTSFGLLHKKCSAAVMITASHNPPKYNGYKVYWSYGGQVLPPHDVGIIAEPVGAVKITELPNPLVHEVGEEIDRAYIDTVRPLQLHEGDNHTHGKELKVIYTPLHGSGVHLIPRLLRDWGFANLTLIEEQCTLDGAFPTVQSPNPEDPKALSLGVKKLQEVYGDLLIGTDPDADRIALVVMHAGRPIYLNGNESAALALEHICRSLEETHQKPPKATCVKTIVTSELLQAIAARHDMHCLDVLTGFKYIGEKIAQWEEEKASGLPYHHFLFGGEESYGYLIGTHARDKDAVVSAALFCEAALHQKLQGKTLFDLLLEIYAKYGVYREKLLSFTYEGKEGLEKMQKMMEKLRAHPPQTIGAASVERFEDYLARMATNLPSRHTEPLTLPQSDVLRFWLSDQTKIVVRPSGTEPKIKIYIACFEKHSGQNIEKTLQECDRRLEENAGHLRRLLAGESN